MSEPAVGGPPADYRTSTFRALDFEFAVHLASRPLGRYLDRVFESLRGPGDAEHLYSVIDRAGSRIGRYAVLLDGYEVSSPASPARTLSFLMSHINREAIGSSAQLVLVHAAAAALGGESVLLPGPAETGKSTLVAGLVRAGLQYVTDEAVAVDPHTGSVLAYPKPITIDAGAWSALADLEPHAEAGVRPFLSTQWHVPAASISDATIAMTSRARLIVFPRFDPSSPTTLTPLSRAEALGALVECCFTSPMSGRQQLDTLADVVRGCDCYRLQLDELGAAVRCIDALLGRPVGAMSGARS